MGSNVKNIYRDFCSKHQLPIFYQPWWLDAVAPEQWQVILAKKGHEISGVFPYVWKKKNGFRFIQMPPLTPFLGVWINYPENQNYHNRLSYEKETINNIVKQLPLFDHFNSRMPYRLTNWLPFYWNEFCQTMKYTYIIDFEKYKSFDNVKKQFSSRIIRNRKKAINTYHIAIEESTDVELFYQINRLTFERKGMKIPYNYQLVKNIFDITQKHQSSKILIAKNEQNVPVAGVFLIIDKDSCYYLMGGIDARYKHTEANSLLFYTAIEKMFGQVKIFNFEGSMIEPIEKFFRAFGAEQMPYFQISKTPSKIIRWYKIVKNIYP